MVGVDPTCMVNTSRYYTVREVAAEIDRGQDWLWRACRSREVPHQRRGRNYYFTLEDVRVIKTMLAPTPVPMAVAK